MSLHHLCASDLRRQIVSGEITAAAVTRHFLDRIDRHNAALGAFLAVDPAAAIAAAGSCDERLARGEAPRLLEGLPVAVKDNIVTRDLPTTCGSRRLDGFVAGWDAEVVRRIRVAGGVVIGKTNLDEFGMGSSGENSAFFPTRNPADRERVPGGSSSGSAAAVAAGLAPLALGSDTGGSVRQPAAFCGITGLKPTWGRISRRGLVAFASSFDQVGPLARDVGGVLLLLTVLAGEDAGDATSIPGEVPEFSRDFAAEGARIGLAEEQVESLPPDSREVILDAVGRFTDAGGEVVPISLPHATDALAVYYLLANAEASSNLARFDGVRYGVREAEFGEEVKRRLLLGTFALTAGYADRHYQRATRARRLIADDFGRAFVDVDLIVGPTTPEPPFPLGDRARDPLAMYLSDTFTTPAAVAGLPAVSVPCGVDSAGLPVGLQITGPALSEGRLLAAARFVEERR